MHQFVNDGKLHVRWNLVLGQLIVRRIQNFDDGALLPCRPIDVPQSTLLQVPDPDNPDFDLPVFQMQALLPQMKPVMDLFVTDDGWEGRDAIARSRGGAFRASAKNQKCEQYYHLFPNSFLIRILGQEWEKFAFG